MKSLKNGLLLLVFSFLIACSSSMNEDDKKAVSDDDTMVFVNKTRNDTAIENGSMVLHTDGSDDKKISPDGVRDTAAAEETTPAFVEESAKILRNADGTRGNNNASAEEEKKSEINAALEDLQQACTKKVAVHCPRKMTYKQTSDVIGFVADLIDDSLIKERMQTRVRDAIGEDDFVVDDKNLLVRELKMYNNLELRLDDAGNEGFLIKKIHDDDAQEINENMEGWHWKVTPITTNPEQQLVLKVIVYDTNHNRVQSFDKTYHVDIKIESKLFLINTKALFIENPEWAFASIIAPIVTFFLGRLNAVQRRRKEKIKNELPDKEE